MSEKMNLTGDLRGFLNGIEQSWTRPRGLFYAFIVELLILTGCQSAFQNLLSLGVIFICITTATWIIWLITSKRILFRCWWIAVMVLVFSSMMALLFYSRIYQLLFAHTKYDLPYIQIWGSAIFFLFFLTLGFLIDVYVVKGEKLMIIFAVNNESVKIEKIIRASIDPVVQKIHDEDNRIKLIVLPFGVIKSNRKGEKYIKAPFTRADAIIFASVIDDSDSIPAGYVFTEFSSRINEKRFMQEERTSSAHNNILKAFLRSRGSGWNFLNSANDNCSRKIAIAQNLEDMIKMYIGCIYLMKHDFKAALPYTDSAIYREKRSSPAYLIASSLFSYSVLSAAREYEEQEQDYDAALYQLEKLVKTIPVTNNDPAYNKAMARVMFYKGDIKSSEVYTKRFKDLPDHRWGYELNMGFYAINKKKILEFVQHYKNLRRYQPYNIEEVDFAINFLDRQKKGATDKEYICLLEIAIAYLHLYKNPKKAKKLMQKAEFNSSNAKSCKAMAELQTIAMTSTLKLKNCHQKKRRVSFVSFFNPKNNSKGCKR